MGYNWGHPGMWAYDGGGWTWAMGVHGIVWLIFLVLLVVGAVMLIRYLWRAGHAPHYPHHHAWGAESALAILETRYARGEIEREEYLQKKQDLLS